MSLIKQSAQLTELAVQQAAGWRKVEKAGSDSEAVHQKGKTKVHVFELIVVKSKELIRICIIDSVLLNSKKYKHQSMLNYQK